MTFEKQTADAPLAMPIHARPERLNLPAVGSVREGLIAAMTNVLTYARAQDARADATKAVHEFRKSVRRARALTKHMQGVIGLDAYQEVSATLREIHRSTSPLRDRHVVIDVINGLGLEPKLDEPAAGSNKRGGKKAEAWAVAEALKASIEAKPAPSPDAIAAVLDAGCRQIEALPGVVAGAVPGRVTWFAAVDGLATTHRRARARLHEVERGSDDEAIHSLRKRVKELTYQVELYSELGGGSVRKQRKRLATLSEQLGAVADLMVLRAYVREHSAAGAEQDCLLGVIEKARARHLARALKRADELLDNNSEKFARKIVDAVRAGRQRSKKRARLQPTPKPVATASAAETATGEATAAGQP